jgi:hypothetical protein
MGGPITAVACGGVHESRRASVGLCADYLDGGILFQTDGSADALTQQHSASRY